MINLVTQKKGALDFFGIQREENWLATLKGNKGTWFWGLARISMGWIFLWAFLDKTFGLGYATPKERSWISGSSPSEGYLLFAVRGPFAETFGNLAGSVAVDWLLMMGFLLIGVALITGIGVKVAGYAGAIMMVLFYASAMWPEHNPFMDDHLMYALLLIAFAHSQAGSKLGLGGWWSRNRLVQKYKFLA